jgi:acetyltransferase
MDAAHARASVPGFVRDPAHDLFGECGAIDAMFHPKTVAVLGAASQPGSLGHQALAALTGSAFEGSVVVVDPRTQANAFGVPVYPSFQDMPTKAELAIVVTASSGVFAAVEQCAAAGVRGVAVLSAVDTTDQHFGDLQRNIRQQLRQTRMRMIGPGCCALMNPSIGLNASPNLPMPLPGSVAFIGQSGSLATAILDWGRRKIVGFSAFVSLGALVDVGWGNLIDYFGSDTNTRTILIHMESIVNMRSFLSAAREVALQKPIIIIKAGRTGAAARAFAWHSTCTVSDDDVLDAALRRVGVLRVASVEDLFHTADALSKERRPEGPRLAVVSNAGGPGVLAADQVAREVGEIVPLASDTAIGVMAAPDSAEAVTPMDVLGDGSSGPFLEAAETAIKDPSNDGVLLVLVPQAMSDPVSAVQGLLAMDHACKPVLLCAAALGELPREQEVHACFPVLPTVSAAARTFNHMWRYSYDLKAIYETPELHAEVTERALSQRVGELIAGARRAGRDLSECEWREVLAVYGILIFDAPANQTEGQRDAQRDAQREGQREEQRTAPLAANARASAETVGYEFQIGSSSDPEFGPVLWFGAGGRFAHMWPHRVVGLPPLNATLARRMLERSPFFSGLQDLCARGALNLATIDAALVRLSQLVIEHPSIKDIQIDPLVVSAAGVLALDARITLHGPEVEEHDLPRSPFRPYPLQYVSNWTTKPGETVTIRPIRAEDEPLMVAFHKRLSEDTVYQRYFQMVTVGRRTAHEALTRICFVDYDREMVLVAERRDARTGERSIVAIADLTKLYNTKKAEVAVVVRDDCQRHGLGFELIRRLADVARDERLENIVATTMTENRGMCAVFRRLGFTLSTEPGDDTVEAALTL